MRRHSPTRPLAFVYIARDEVTGLFKVGYSVDPLQRLARLKITVKHPVTLLATSEGDPDDRGTLEHTIHRALEETHAYGEWFHPSPFLQRCIEACSSATPPELPETVEEAILVRLTLIDEAWATLPCDRDGPQDPRLALVDAAALKAKRRRPAAPPLCYTRPGKPTTPDLSGWTPDGLAYWGEYAAAGLL